MQFEELRGPQPSPRGGPQLVLHSFAISAGCCPNIDAFFVKRYACAQPAAAVGRQSPEKTYFFLKQSAARIVSLGEGE